MFLSVSVLVFILVIAFLLGMVTSLIIAVNALGRGRRE